MDFKLGGGRHLQPFDPENGQYTDKDIMSLREKDLENLVLIYIFGMDYRHLKIHFPDYRIHDKEYCDIFVKYVRNYVKNSDVIIEEPKMRYLLTIQYGRDKSSFLRKKDITKPT